MKSLEHVLEKDLNLLKGMLFPQESGFSSASSENHIAREDYILLLLRYRLSTILGSYVYNSQLVRCDTERD